MVGVKLYLLSLFGVAIKRTCVYNYKAFLCLRWHQTLHNTNISTNRITSKAFLQWTETILVYG